MRNNTTPTARTAVQRRLSALCLTSLLALAPLAPSHADDGAVQQLQHFIENVTSASGEFSQQAVGRPVQDGKFAFQRPGKFRWETTHPHEQVITSDGHIVRQYDPDLAQVTERPADSSLGSSPAAILFGSGRLEDAFTLTPLPEDDGLQWLRATPRQADAGFQYLDIGFRKQQPARLLLLDAFDQVSRIDLSRMTLNPQLADSLFQLQVPADVDVVRLQ